ncbi:hypothetical protein ACQ4PT_010890 [Festuca glaucescens]
MELSRRYGPVMLLKLGEVPTVFISSAEGAAQALKTNDLAFSSRPRSVTLDIFGGGGKAIAFAPYGDHWRRMRKVCVMELISSKQVRRMEGIRVQEVGNLLGSITASNGATLNVSQMLAALSVDVVTQAVFGGKFAQQDEYLREVDKAFVLVSGSSLVDLFPSSRLVRWLSSAERRMRSCYGRIQCIITDIIDERKAARDGSHGVCGTNEEDLLGVLLRLQLEDSLQFHLTAEFSGGKSKPKLPPGPWTLPIIGSLHHIISALPHRRTMELSRRYGPVMLLKLGEVPTVFISNAEGAAQALKTNDLAFSSRPRSVTLDIFGGGGKDIAFAPYGDHWRRMCKVCVMELISSKQVRRMEGIRVQEVGNLLGSITASNGATLNVSQMLAALSVDVVTQAVFGGKFAQQDEYLREVDKAFVLVSGSSLVDLFPSSWLVRWLSSDERRMRSCYGRIQRIITDIIDERKAARDGSHGVCGTNEEDLLGVLLRLQLEDSLQFHLTAEFSGGKSKPKLPPGPWTLPIIGSLHHIISALPHRRTMELSRRYGPVMLLKLGEVPTVFISSAEGAAQALKTNDLAFSSRPRSVTLDIAFAPYGDHWRQMRKVCVMELISSKQVRRMEGIRVQEVGNLLGSITASNGATLIVSQMLAALSVDVVTQAVFGGKFAQQDEYLREVDKAFVLVSGSSLVDLFPSSRLVRWLSSDERHMRTCYGRIQRIITDIIDERKAARDGSHGVCGTNEEDLLGVLLRLQLEDSLQFPLTAENEDR